MTTLRYLPALGKALRDEMERDADLFVVGEDVRRIPRSRVGSAARPRSAALGPSVLALRARRREDRVAGDAGGCVRPADLGDSRRRPGALPGARGDAAGTGGG